MPRPRAESWLSHTPPQTPLQRIAYLDTCTKWLVCEPDDAGGDALCALTRYIGPEPPTVDPAAGATRAIATSLSDVHVMPSARKTCAMCGSTGAVDIVCVNPYAQQPVVLLCAKCSA